MTLLNNLLRNGNARADTIFLFSLTKGGVGDLMLRKVSHSEGERPQYLLSGNRLAVLLSESGVDQSFFTLDSSGRYHHPKRAARLGTPVAPGSEFIDPRHRFLHFYVFCSAPVSGFSSNPLRD